MQQQFTMFLISDNQDIKKCFQKKHKVIVFEINILHTDSQYTKNIKNTETDIINKLSEYLILCKAKTIHSIGKSGFSNTASWFYQNKILFTNLFNGNFKYPIG